ncbi:MAG: nucleotidyltransferase family protein [Prevotella sp.]|nr:nucleotidyltransferase family protein [Prevotella sp.]
MTQIDWIIERCNEVLFGFSKGQDPVSSLNTQELDRNLAEASRHGMLPLVMESLSKTKLSDPEIKKVVLKWYGACEQSKKNYWKCLGLMEQLALQFKKAGLDVMFLKGATTAQLYPEPQLRVFGDIDYYMFGDSDKSVQVLKDMGVETEEYFNHHTQASFNGVLLENHYDFLDRDNHRGNLLLDDELKRLANVEGHRYPFKFENTEADNAYSLSPTMNAIFLMRHMAIHFFSESVALRMLYDWALFQKKYADEVDWDKMQKLYKKSGMPAFPRMIQGILVSKLGLDMSDCPIQPIYNATADRIWQSIIESPESDPYKKNSVRFLLYEARVFVSNRWKHQLVFENESYWTLFFSYTWLYIKKIITG